MRTILAIWQRELRAYFVSPIAYVVLTIFSLIVGFFFVANLSSLIQASMMQGGQAQPIDVPGIVSQAVFGTMSVILLFMLPMLTMGLFAEEKRRGTLELLLTAPVSPFQALMGKYLASVTMVIAMLLLSGMSMSTLFIYGDPDLKPILGGYLGLFLYSAALLSIGLFISTLTENQIVSVILTFGAILVLWVIDALSSWSMGSLRDVLAYLSVIGHLEDFMKGVLDTSHIVFYLSFVFIGLFLTYRSLESLRWKN
jgi:ABC-2 type transport system permease protein